MKDYEFKISQFVDNELSANEQQELFRYLSENSEARKTLVDFMEVKNEAKSFYAGLNVEMDDSKIVTAGITAQNKKEEKFKSMFYFSAAASIIFAFLFLINQFKENPILTKYQNLQTEMIELQENYSDALNKQNELLKINNQLYAETKKFRIAQLVLKKKSDEKAPRIELPKVETQKRKKERRSHTTGNSGRMVAALQNVQTIEITKNDFLGGQIIGN